MSKKPVVGQWTEAEEDQYSDEAARRCDRLAAGSRIESELQEAAWLEQAGQHRPARLGIGHVVQHAIARAGLEAGEVEDVIMGCANPEGATGANIARQIALMADLPISVSGMTVNRFCSSGLQTIALASQRVIAGEGEVYVAGGVESISCVQQEMNTHMLQDLALAKPMSSWPVAWRASPACSRK